MGAALPPFFNFKKILKQTKAKQKKRLKYKKLLYNLAICLILVCLYVCKVNENFAKIFISTLHLFPSNPL